MLVLLFENYLKRAKTLRKKNLFFFCVCKYIYTFTYSDLPYYGTANLINFWNFFFLNIFFTYVNEKSHPKTQLSPNEWKNKFPPDIRTHTIIQLVRVDWHNVWFKKTVTIHSTLLLLWKWIVTVFWIRG